ncbi:putative peptidyl-prolyl cis-trans isomerase [Aspergillus clavatus NRRL 1]|uniref:Peptidyl-prolyl isomerase CWC27 n=1 Tax=Aspergillus clavatus (strain ATCC 1007 / CBS 513.65 / DSM 816 / NCTC 3887 / NRRL 1 / QM 1276 / 107) TaxID=344612 RepID=A1C5G2_ASPCL|nr:peptidyl-prolyl cis-trans isomerase, putative [Aspergillus clavatus NRRL 1]EAW14930.1 peptidyl-prolyl cis-trans isomerase, putative [Aspergillus clavatus NRRL 1]
MSSHYTTEPAPTASATLNTTFGPIHISLFAAQTPLTCKNFLQHCLDDYYAGTIFHRIVPDFIVQGGDPTGIGSGGTSIYEDPEFEYDPEARDPNEKVVLRDELHSRLRFNRRGLVGMAKSEDGSYGSQFFVTLANTERELNGQCTLFGRVEGDSIYNVLKIAEAERVEGTERPVYPVKVLSCEVGELGPFAGKLKKRETVARAPAAEAQAKPPAAKKKKKAKAGKTLLSFGGDEGDEELVVRPAKPKFNSTLVTDAKIGGQEEAPKKNAVAADKTQTRKRARSPSPTRNSPSLERRTRPKTPDPAMQLPLPDPESPARSPSHSPPARPSILSRTNAEIENLKASMRRTVATGPADTGRKKSALEAMIPETAIRGRKRPPPGSVANASRGGGGGGSSTNGVTGFSSAENEALRMFNAFKAKLEGADTTPASSHKASAGGGRPEQPTGGSTAEPEDEEAQLCDLHFIANCQSCRSWDDPGAAETAADEDDRNWLSHELRFGKDMLGKDLNWKREHPEDLDSLVVIDPREREKELTGGRRRGLERDRERERKRERVGDREWDRRK